MVLFTSKEDLDTVYRSMGSRPLPFTLLKPKDGASQSATIEEFRRTKGVLLATGVFWEGVNIAGDDLSSVIITRLPFPVPDPVIEYKTSLVSDRFDVLVPEMLVKLRQGAGRLIRSETDKGILSILDSRVSVKSNKNYKCAVYDALPIKHRITSLEDFANYASRLPYVEEEVETKS